MHARKALNGGDIVTIISCNVNTLACFIICLAVKKCVQVCQCVKCYATTLCLKKTAQL